MVRFQRQPPGTAITRACLLVGMSLAAAAAFWIVDGEAVRGGGLAGLGAALLLFGGHRANHGEGGPVDRMLTELFDRAWDGCVLGAVVWTTRDLQPSVAAGALLAVCASFLSSYVRARGAALGYSVEESHVARGIRYALITAGLLFGWLGWTVWAAAGVSVLAVVVRTGQVAREDRA
ncbi:MAG: hypothetical protein ACM3OO_09585 [Planctomycetaceae bacterium]